MKKVLKIILSGLCLVAVSGCAYICLYEIYNSYFAKEPKNVITYHKATAPDTGTSSTIDKTADDDNLDNRQFPSETDVNTESVGERYTNKESKDLNDSSPGHIINSANDLK